MNGTQWAIALVGMVTLGGFFVHDDQDARAMGLIMTLIITLIGLGVAK